MSDGGRSDGAAERRKAEAGAAEDGRRKTAGRRAEQMSDGGRSDGAAERRKGGTTERRSDGAAVDGATSARICFSSTLGVIPLHIMVIRSVRDLEVYQDAFAFQQAVFLQSKSWPREETYSLTDQVRRSSRSIGANLSEAWAKRRYPAHFLAKLTDADAELQESIHWVDTARACGYLADDAHGSLLEHAARVGRLLGSVMAKHESFCLK